MGAAGRVVAVSILGTALWSAEGEPIRPPGAVDRPAGTSPDLGTRFPRPEQPAPQSARGLWADNERLRWERDAALARVAELGRTVEALKRLIVHAAGHDKAVAS